jgi:hypothetical protein
MHRTFIVMSPGLKAGSETAVDTGCHFTKADQANDLLKSYGAGDVATVTEVERYEQTPREWLCRTLALGPKQYPGVIWKNCLIDPMQTVSKRPV